MVSSKKNQPIKMTVLINTDTAEERKNNKAGIFIKFSKTL